MIKVKHNIESAESLTTRHKMPRIVEVANRNHKENYVGRDRRGYSDHCILFFSEKQLKEYLK